MRAPNVGETLTDFQGRTFTVDEIDRRTGQIRGKVTAPYSCDQTIFEAVWVEKRPPSDPATMKIG